VRFYAPSHSYTCGIDLHRRTLYPCGLDRDGRVVLRRKLPCRGEAFLAAFEPYRAALVVGCECLFSWYWLADPCAEAEIDFVLGHALGMRRIHGTETKNDKLDSEKSAEVGDAVRGLRAGGREGAAGRPSRPGRARRVGQAVRAVPGQTARRASGA
jgi:hypothetical protein